MLNGQKHQTLEILFVIHREGHPAEHFIGLQSLVSRWLFGLVD